MNSFFGSRSPTDYAATKQSGGIVITNAKVLRSRRASSLSRGVLCCKGANPWRLFAPGSATAAPSVALGTFCRSPTILIRQHVQAQQAVIFDAKSLPIPPLIPPLICERWRPEDTNRTFCDRREYLAAVD